MASPSQLPPPLFKLLFSFSSSSSYYHPLSLSFLLLSCSIFSLYLTVTLSQPNLWTPPSPWWWIAFSCMSIAWKTDSQVTDQKIWREIGCMFPHSYPYLSLSLSLSICASLNFLPTNWFLATYEFHDLSIFRQ